MLFPRPTVSPALPALAALSFGVLACPAADERPAPYRAATATSGDTTPVPEPSLLHVTMSLFGFCLLLRRRR